MARVKRTMMDLLKIEPAIMPSWPVSNGPSPMRNPTKSIKPHSALVISPTAVRPEKGQIRLSFSLHELTQRCCGAGSAQTIAPHSVLTQQFFLKNGLCADFRKMRPSEMNFTTGIIFRLQSYRKGYNSILQTQNQLFTSGPFPFE